MEPVWITEFPRIICWLPLPCYFVTSLLSLSLFHNLYLFFFVCASPTHLRSLLDLKRSCVDMPVPLSGFDRMIRFMGKKWKM
ncbi:hypothetical protein OPV22_002055 [Ensete ventricosum]|uniref:Uncharacterized protein n=1 Tax=Ensete ventricosum TaxID=4639 RepID=A0AAV8RWU7_ENSVE|nr:hypothetical protein OPV22_002055 [Ensete ventricosum]